MPGLKPDRFCTRCELVTTRDTGGRCKPCIRRRAKGYRKQHRIRCARYRARNPKKVQASKSAYYHSHLQFILLRACQKRAELQGVPFNLVASDLVVPDICPVLGIPLVVGTKRHHPSSPSVDRIVPKKGYVKSNVLVVSFRANTLKRDASIEELQRLSRFYRKFQEK